MKLDSGNRGFVAAVALAFAAYVAVGAAACVLVAILAYRVSSGGVGVLADEGAVVWPALAFLAVIAAGAVLGFRSVIGQLRSSLALARRVRALARPLPPALREVADRSGLRGRVRLVAAPEAFSFAYGALTPRVAVSQGLVDATTARELEAVLLHERYHVRNLDPLKVVVARASAAAFFYLPALRDLRARYVAGRELAADRGASERLGRAPLAGALLKVVRGPDWRELHAAAAIGGPELLDARVAQLEAGSEPPLASVSRRGVLLSVSAAALLAAVAVVPIIALGGVAAVTRAAMPEMGEVSVLGVLSMAGCAGVLALALLGGYGLLALRARRQLDTTRA